MLPCILCLICATVVFSDVEDHSSMLQVSSALATDRGSVHIDDEEGANLPLAAPKGHTLDGSWNKGTIAGTTLTWRKSRHETDLELLSPTKVRMTMKGTEYTGVLHEDGKLHWSDGDVWMKGTSTPQRLLGEESSSEEGPASSRKPAKAKGPEECKTNDVGGPPSGKHPGLQCVFPFIYKGKDYKACTTFDASPKHIPWCAVKVDEGRKMVKDQWGTCVDACFEDSGQIDPDITQKLKDEDKALKSADKKSEGCRKGGKEG